MPTFCLQCSHLHRYIKYAKNVYRNWLTDSHFDDLLNVSSINYKHDIIQNSEKNISISKITLTINYQIMHILHII
ncbi:zinc finger BED domain-containing protein 5-like, partial [Aphis craccivora]